MSLVTFSMLIAVFFSNSKLASIVAPVLLFSSILPRYIFFSTNDEEQAEAKYAASLFSPTAFTFGADIIASYEYGNIGVQWDTVEDGAYSLGGCIRMMLLDFVLYAVLAVYLDKVLPQEHGTPLSPLFFLHKHYWFPPTASSLTATAQSSSADEDMGMSASESPQGGGTRTGPGHDRADEEPIPAHQMSKRVVQLKGLRKRYPDGKLAVRNLNLSLLEGQITCLLGSNGAGKSSTIGVLTGLLPATAGDVTVYGNSIRTDMQSIRQITGICPQTNVIIPSLTVDEHLQVSLSLRLKDRFLYTVGFLYNVEWCIRQPWCSSIIPLM